MWEHPDPGDIVWCRFPQQPRDVSGPKPRPALVISVTEHADGIAVGDQRTVVLPPDRISLLKNE